MSFFPGHPRAHCGKVGSKNSLGRPFRDSPSSRCLPSADVSGERAKVQAGTVRNRSSEVHLSVSLPRAFELGVLISSHVQNVLLLLLLKCSQCSRYNKAINLEPLIPKNGFCIKSASSSMFIDMYDYQASLKVHWLIFGVNGKDILAAVTTCIPNY